MDDLDFLPHFLLFVFLVTGAALLAIGIGYFSY
jgi:hypothetical protein